MPEITLLSTLHEEIGNCTSAALLVLLKEIKPDVIFEELPPSYFEAYYKDFSRSNLESKAITYYRSKYSVEQVLVDSDDVPSDEFLRSYPALERRVSGLGGLAGFNFRSANSRLIEAVSSHGFRFLNQGNIGVMQKAKDCAIEKGLGEINDPSLIEFFRSWRELHDKRENHMLQKIYEYSDNHNYERAVFLCGAAHRDALIEKIERMQESARVKVDWGYSRMTCFNKMK